MVVVLGMVHLYAVRNREMYFASPALLLHTLTTSSNLHK